MSDLCVKPDRGDVEDTITDAMGDVRLLDIVLAEANDSPRLEREQPAMMVPEDTFIAWQRACRNLANSVRKVERQFYEAGQ